MNDIQGENVPKSFVNKIRNASRYVLGNVDDNENPDIDFTKITDTDKWILHGLNNVIEKVNDHMDHSRTKQAVNVLYRFFKHEYCDWYIEFTKGGTASPGAIQNTSPGKILKLTLLKLLRLFHPFTPGIAEEIYEELEIGGAGSLDRMEYPSFCSEWVFSREYNDIETLKRVIKETRKTRSENKLPPKRRIDVFLKTESEKEKAALTRNLNYFDFLVKSAKTEVVPGFENLPKGFKGACLNWEILLPFDNDEDRIKEVDRLKKELEKTEILIDTLERKFSDETFIDNTPEPDVIDLKKNLQGNIDKRDKIRKTIHDLS